MIDSVRSKKRELQEGLGVHCHRSEGLERIGAGKYKLFNCDSVEKDEWENTEFLRESEEKGVTIDATVDSLWP